MIVDWPFITSRVTSTSTFGVFEFDVYPQAFAARSARSIEGRFVTAEQTFGGEAALQPWLAVSGRLTAGTVMGRTPPAVIAVGAQVVYGGELGLAFRLAGNGRIDPDAAR